MNHGTNDVRPSVENAGLTIRSQFKGAIDPRQAKARQQEGEQQTNAVKAHLAKIENYNSRDIFTATDSGLPIVGPAAGDSNSVVGLAHNAAMVSIEAQIAALISRIAALESAKK